MVWANMVDAKKKTNPTPKENKNRWGFGIESKNLVINNADFMPNVKFTAETPVNPGHGTSLRR
jgi:hypothetical protein